MAPMTFRNFGGAYQLRIESADDLRAALDLPEALWVATSAPVGDLICDPVFLNYLDSDHNGRIRTDELQGAIRWTFRMLSGSERLAEETDWLRLGDVNVSHEDGARVQAVAERIVAEKADAVFLAGVTLAQVRQRLRVLEEAPNNGDGIVPPGNAVDPATAALLRAIMDSVGSARDLSGQAGVGEEQVAVFEAKARAFLEWRAEAWPGGGATPDPVILPWAEATGPAWALLERLDVKVRHFFAACDFVQMDPASAAIFGIRDEERATLASDDRAALEERLRRAPIARPNAQGILDATDGINPVYEADLREAREVLGACLKRVAQSPSAVNPDPPVAQSPSAVTPPTVDLPNYSVFTAEGGCATSCGPTRIVRGDWDRAFAMFAPYRQWLARKRGGCVETLEAAQLTAWLAGPPLEAVRALIAADLAAREELERTRDVEKLILYQRWLIPFANNFIGFAYFYDPARQPLFGLGRLVMGGRDIAFATRVDDRKAHKAAAEAAYLHVLYVELTGRAQDPAERFEVACPVTAGEAAGLAIGKRGIFQTPDGRVWDARVTDLIANPVSLWEAARAPFDRIGEYIQRYGERWHKTQQSQLDAAAALPVPGAATTVAGPTAGAPVAGTTAHTGAPWFASPAVNAPAMGAASAAKPVIVATPEKGGLGGLILIGGILAGSVSLAALSAAFAYVAKTLHGFTFWRAVVVVLVLLALLILPSVLLAWLRLRRRNVAALLEASGWAINPRLKIRRRLGRLLTHRPRLPEGSVCERHDVVGDFAGRFAAVSTAPLERLGATAGAVGRGVARAVRPIVRRLRGVPSDKPPRGV